jgi:hypothetical protein
MRPFEVDGSKYVRINGKSFYLLRGYKIRYDKFIFVQVFGRAALTKDDLPEKNWELVSTKGAEGRVYTAWKPGFFDGSNETRLFLGTTKEASLRLLLAALAPHVDAARAVAAAFRTDDAYNAGRIRYDLGITEYDDAGNSGVPAYGLEHRYKFNAWITALTEAPCPTH